MGRSWESNREGGTPDSTLDSAKGRAPGAVAASLAFIVVVASSAGTATGCSSSSAESYDATGAAATTGSSCGTDVALSRCLHPKPEFVAPEAKSKLPHYAAESYRYFLTMTTDQSANLPIAKENALLIGDFERPLRRGEWNPINKWFSSTTVIPSYAPLVIRFEFPPWLLTTGYGAVTMRNVDEVLRKFTTNYKVLDCRNFDVQPFGRCHLVFLYGRDDPATPADDRTECPIYEEFTFNDAGETTFIEAWSDDPSYLPMDAEDQWAEGSVVNRLSTAVPGLGRSDGRIDPNSRAMWDAAEAFDRGFVAPYWDTKKISTGPFTSMLHDINGHVGQTPFPGRSVSSFWPNWVARTVAHAHDDILESCHPPALP